MRRINLLPPEERRRGLSGFQNRTLGILLAAFAAVVAIIAVVTIILLFRVNAVEDRVAELDRSIAEQTARRTELAPYADLEDELAAKEPVANGIVRSRFAWDQFLSGLAFIIPETTALESLTAEASPVDINAPVGQTLPPGAVTFTGLAEPDYTNVADFVVRMNTLRFLANSELDLAELDRDTFASPALNFEVSSELVTEVGADESEVRLEDAQATPASEGQNAPVVKDQYANGDQAGAAVEDQYAANGQVDGTESLNR